MPESIGTTEKIGKPLSVGGVTTLLVGLCGYLSPEHQKIGILLSSFLSPLIIHIAFSILIRVTIDPSLTRYIGALKRDLRATTRQLKKLDKKSNAFKELTAHKEKTIFLMVSAHQDFASGKLSLKEIPKPDLG